MQGNSSLTRGTSTSEKWVRIGVRCPYKWGRRQRHLYACYITDVVSYADWPLMNSLCGEIGVLFLFFVVVSIARNGFVSTRWLLVCRRWMLDVKYFHLMC